jgi:hypothetical protein
MQARFNSSHFLTIPASFLTALFLMSAGANADPPGLNYDGRQELRDAGVDKYLGNFVADESDFGVWTKHTFDPQYTPDAGYPLGVRPDGPVCIAGTEYSVFTKEGDPKKVLIFLQGGGACWQGFYNCNILADDQAPPPGPAIPWRLRLQFSRQPVRGLLGRVHAVL